MKKILTAALMLMAVSLMAFKVAVDPIPVGSSLPLPDNKMTDISGKKVSLADSRGKNGLLVIFSCNTCPYVIKNQARINEICAYAKENNVGVIIVNSNEAFREKDDSPEAMKAYAEKNGMKWSYVIDHESRLANAFGANRTPECFLFNSSDKLVYHGAIDDSPSDENNVKRKHLKEAIDETVSGKEVSVKTSRSVGCTIKRKG